MSSCLELRAAEYLKFDWKIAACLDHKIQRHAAAAGFARLYSRLRWVVEPSSCFLVHHSNCATVQELSLSLQVRSGSKAKPVY